MNDSEFCKCSEAALAMIEARLDASGSDVDYFMSGDGVLEIECAGGGKIVVNRHRAAQEIWVASRLGGTHFRWDGQNWRSTQDGKDLLAVLSARLSADLGADVDLS